MNKTQENIQSGIITNTPILSRVFPSKDSPSMRTYWDYEFTFYSSKRERIECVKIRSIFDLHNWSPLSKGDRIDLSFKYEKTKDGKSLAKKSEEDKNRYIANIVKRMKDETPF